MNRHGVTICPKDCPERSVHCHSTCKSYIEKSARHAAEREAQYKDNRTYDTIMCIRHSGMTHGRSTHDTKRRAQQTHYTKRKIKNAPTEAATPGEADVEKKGHIF